MLNIEKYKNKLIELGVIDINRLALKGGIPYRCDGDSCDDCDFKNSEKGCYIYGCTDWLFSEYKEPEVDWSKVTVDTPILVSDDDEEDYEDWEKAYFAKFEDGKIYAWIQGKTSWTVYDEKDLCVWDYARLAERKETNNNGWIPCSERLPEKNTNVIACFSHGLVTEMRYEGNGIFQDIYEYSTDVIRAWQQLPEPYREEDIECD